MVDWGDGIKLLYSACHGLDRTGFPSWVPNWAAREVPDQRVALKLDGCICFDFEAASTAEPHLRLTSSDHRVVRGLLIGTIAKIVVVGANVPIKTVLDPSGFFTRNLSVVTSFAEDLNKFLEQHRAYPPQPDKSVKDVIWRTLCEMLMSSLTVKPCLLSARTLTLCSISR